jgi:hypothetical protein
MSSGNPDYVSLASGALGAATAEIQSTTVQSKFLSFGEGIAGRRPLSSKRVMRMKTSWVILILLASVHAYANHPAMSTAQTKLSEIQSWATDTVIVEAVEQENDKAKSLDQIKTIDTRWQKSTRVTKMIRPFLVNKCASRLKKFKADAGYVEEIFVMDNQGAIVCATDMTSDYWQGDEAKFQKAYRGGAGAMFVAEPEFDDSTQEELVQISVPLFSKEATQAIGVMTVGINVNKLSQ